MLPGRAVTVAPLAAARAVADPQITEILSLKTGRIFGVCEFVTRHSHERIVRLRNTILEAMIAGRPRWVCPLCLVPVYLVASPMKAFFFRHRHEDGSCPAVTRSPESVDEIRARKYDGLQESEPHRRLKALVMRSVASDPRFSQAETEKIWKGLSASGGRRRPDVSCRYGEQRIAFEAQLTTTFLSVVVGRRIFYRAEGGLLIWVLASFDPARRRLTEEDICFPNNSNVLVIDDETTAASERAGRFMVRCWHRVPGASRGDATDWTSRLAGFDELTLDQEGQRAFLVDVEGEEVKARTQIQREQARDRETAIETLRRDILDWLTAEYRFDDLSVRDVQWLDLRQRSSEFGLNLPIKSWAGEGLERLIKLVDTARAGRPVGWKFRKLSEVAHHLHDQHPKLLLLFGHLLKELGHAEALKQSDTTGAWARKTARLPAAIKADPARFTPDPIFLDFLAFMFPDTRPAVQRMRQP